MHTYEEGKSNLIKANQCSKLRSRATLVKMCSVIVYIYKYI